MSEMKVVGRTEIADLLDVDSRTPHAWMARRLLPSPDHESVNGSPAWDRETIVIWAAQTGRLPESLRDEADNYGVENVADQRGGRVAKRRFGQGL